MPFKIVSADITTLEVDAIVNAANPELRMGGGVCGAVFKAAGASKLQGSCDELAPINTGEAVITPGFELSAKYIIHTVGPIYSQWSPEESERLLRSAYVSALGKAIENECESVAFPLISSGIYGYPKDGAMHVATSTIQEFLVDHEIEVTLVIFDRESYIVNRELLEDVESYIDEHFFEEHAVVERRSMRRLFESSRREVDELEDLIGRIDESFSDMLMRLIDAKGMSDVEVYKRSNIDRKLFSKIRSNKGYMPSKRTAIALAIGLQLSLEETDGFLKRAGFALSNAVKFDVIIEYFIINGNYDVFEINEVLFKYDQALLGG